MCAGLTTFNALRNSGARAGDLVAIHGIGGLGHLGVQYAAKMGFHTVAIARGEDKRPLAKKLGAARLYRQPGAGRGGSAEKVGGARVILATVTSGEAMTAIAAGLGIEGTMIVIGAAGPMSVSPLQLLMRCQSVQGWYSGTSIDSQDTLAFSSLSGVRSMNEVYPFERVAEGYDRMMSGKARFRVVLEMGK